MVLGLGWLVDSITGRRENNYLRDQLERSNDTLRTERERNTAEKRQLQNDNATVRGQLHEEKYRRVEEVAQASKTTIVILSNASQVMIVQRDLDGLKSNISGKGGIGAKQSKMEELIGKMMIECGGPAGVISMMIEWIVGRSTDKLTFYIVEIDGERTSIVNLIIDTKLKLGNSYLPREYIEKAKEALDSIEKQNSKLRKVIVDFRIKLNTSPRSVNINDLNGIENCLKGLKEEIDNFPSSSVIPTANEYIQHEIMRVGRDGLVRRIGQS